MIVATVLLSPHLYTYDLTVLLLPLGLAAARRSIGFQPVRDPSPALLWLALFIFCLAGLSPKVAAATGIQLSVPLMVLYLWANTSIAAGSLFARPPAHPAEIA
jgi:hypothetical protein